jgi:hypothetical protein
MHRIILGLRLWLGALYLLAGINGLLVVVGLDSFGDFSQRPYYFLIEAMQQTGFLLALHKITEVVGGVLLLSNRYVPLALTVLAPITLVIIGVHVFIDLATLPLGLAVALPHLALVFFYRHSFAGLLQRTARPAQH